MRVLRPYEGVFAFYDGRVEGYRFAEGINWVDDGALGLGIAGYAIVSGDEALVYDTHVTVDHARFVRATLEAEGVTEIEALGQEFDPNLHEAVVHEETADFPDNQVIGELQRGYRLRDRVLRPSLVRVANNPKEH